MKCVFFTTCSSYCFFCIVLLVMSFHFLDLLLPANRLFKCTQFQAYIQYRYTFSRYHLLSPAAMQTKVFLNGWIYCYHWILRSEGISLLYCLFYALRTLPVVLLKPRIWWLQKICIYLKQRCSVFFLCLVNFHISLQMWFWVGILRITFEFVAAHAALGQVRLLSYPAIMEKHNMAQVMCVCQLKLSFKHCNTNEVPAYIYNIPCPTFTCDHCFYK